VRIRWSPEAAEDLTHIFHYIRDQNPSAALRVARNIRENIGRLRSFPRLGRLGRVEGTYELPLPPLPFIVIYRIKENLVENRSSDPWSATLAVIPVWVYAVVP
jgi:addiction module RelE/StbE family toxin